MQIQLILFGALVAFVTFFGLKMAFGAEIQDITNYKTYEQMALLQHVSDIETYDTVIINLNSFKAEYQNDYSHGFEFLHLIPKEEIKTLEINTERNEDNNKNDQEIKDLKKEIKELKKEDKEEKSTNNKEEKPKEDPRFNEKYDDIDWQGDEGEPDMTIEEMDKHLEDRKALEEKQEKYKDIQLPRDGTVEDDYKRVDTNSEEASEASDKNGANQQYDQLFNWE